jgi:hypothetical protein
MKKLLFILAMAFGVNCYAQKIPTEIAYVVGKQIIRLENKIDSLEKRVEELESKCVVIVQDSVPHLYHTWGDSMVIEYEKRQMIAPFKTEEK